MVVFILPRVDNTKKSGDIFAEIQDVAGFNVKLKFTKKWREEKTGIFDEEAEEQEYETLTRRLAMSPDSEKSNIRLDWSKVQGHHKRIETPKIIIHDDVLKFDGTKLLESDISETESFGSGIHCYDMKINDGSKVPVITCVFPHESENAVMVKLAQLKTICSL